MDRFCLFRETSRPSQQSRRSPCWNSGCIYWTRTNGSQCRQEEDSAEDRAKRFTDGRCPYWGVFNHRAVECAARKKAQPFKAGGAEVKEAGAGIASEESGNEQAN